MSRRRWRRREPPNSDPERYIGPPTVISLDWDYGYRSVLEDRSPGVMGVVLLDPAELGLSQQLVERLAAWHHNHDVLSGRWIREEPDTEESLDAEAQSARELLALAHDVQHELSPDVEVFLRGRPLTEPR